MRPCTKVGPRSPAPKAGAIIGSLANDGYRGYNEYFYVNIFHSLQMSTDAEPTSNTASLAPRLGLFDITMLVMGGMVGSGIFMNPSFVARQVHTPALILGAWVFGGI